MNKLAHIGLAGLLAVSLVGCEGMSKQDTGVLTGGAVGALIGSQFGHGAGTAAAMAIGTIAGAVIGGQIGHNMDKTDQIYAQRALESNHQNQPMEWTNPDTGYEYTVTPTRTYYGSAHHYCREYITKARIDGRYQQVYGRACRQPDGAWKVVG